MSGLGFRWIFGHSPPPPHHDLPLAPAQSPQETLNSLLEQFNSPGLPASSRFAGDYDPQREGKPLSITGLWRHALFVVTKTTELFADVAAHHIYGPKRKSWGVEMTMVASFMRGLANHTHLTDVPTLRAVMQIGGLIPTPSDALITPVTYRVKRRGLRGMLEKFDAQEDGNREICGEWVVGKRLWQRLQREWRAHHQPGVRESSAHNKVKERVVLYLHGGAYYTASAATHRLITINLSKHIDARVFVINYRLAPDTRFPGPLVDAASAYFRLTDDLNIPPSNIIIAGDSAGAGLSVALMMYLRDEGYPLPGAAILMCPWVDLTMSCASWDTNAHIDIITFPTDPADHMNPVACYLGPEGMRKYITHPYVSPLFGDFTGLPPMLIQVGDCEVLRDEITLMAHKATLAGVDVVHELYEDAVHVFQIYPFLEQSRKAFKSCRRFVFDTLPEIQRRKRQTSEDLSTPKSTDGLSDRVEKELEKEIQGNGDCMMVDQTGEVERVGKGAGDELANKDVDGSSSDSSDGEDGGVPDDLPTQDMDTPSSSPISKTTSFGANAWKPPFLADSPSPTPGTTTPTISISPEQAQRRWNGVVSKSSSNIPSLNKTPASLTSSPPRSRPRSPTVSTRSSLMRNTNNNNGGGPPSRSMSSASLSGSTLPRPTPTSIPMSPSASTSGSGRRSRTNTLSSSTRLSLAPLDMAPAKPSIRSRTASHPDIVQLMKEYEKGGPANRTMTWQMDADA